MHACILQAVFSAQAAQPSWQSICDAAPARTGQEQWQVAPEPMGAQWHRLAHGRGGCALAYSLLKLGMPGADKNTALTMQTLSGGSQKAHGASDRAERLRSN